MRGDDRYVLPACGSVPGRRPREFRTVRLPGAADKRSRDGAATRHAPSGAVAQCQPVTVDT